MIATKMMSHTQTLMANQTNAEYLAKHSLPPVPKKFDGPIRADNTKVTRDIAIIIKSDVHQKETNPGYARQADGRPFYH